MLHFTIEPEFSLSDDIGDIGIFEKSAGKIARADQSVRLNPYAWVTVRSLTLHMRVRRSAQTHSLCRCLCLALTDGRNHEPVTPSTIRRSVYDHSSANLRWGCPTFNVSCQHGLTFPFLTCVGVFLLV